MKIQRVMPVILFFFVCLMAVADSGFAQSGSVRVECVGSDGLPLKDVQVSLLPVDGSKPVDKKSGKDGAAVFEKVPDGVFRVVGRKNDYTPSFFEYVKVHASEESVSLKLEPGMDKKLYFEDPEVIQRSYQLVEAGINASKAGQYADAEKDLLQANELEPSNVQALYYLGVFYVQTKNFDKATEYLEKASNLAKMFAALPPVPGKADPATQQSIYNDAQRLLNNMQTLQGQLALQEKQYDKAVEIFSKAAKDDPDNPDAHYQLALAFTYAGQFEEATREIEKSLQLKPGEKRYADLRDQISAREENAAIKKAQTLLDDGKKLVDTGKAADALVKYNEALGLLAEDYQAPVFRLIAIAQSKLKQTGEAEAAYKKAAELAPAKDAPAYWNSLAQFYLENKKFEQALDALTNPKALGSASAEKVLMDLFEKSKDKEPKLAEATLERVLKVDPENMDAYFLLGQMYYMDGAEKDSKTKELLTKYVANGKDANKIGLAKDMLVIVNRRSK
jgi:Flp pilus assembly protein TadD